MTRRDTIKCVHEPFGDAFYYGPERLSARYENDIAGRVDSGFNDSTYQTVFDKFGAEGTEVRLFPTSVALFKDISLSACSYYYFQYKNWYTSKIGVL